VPSNDPEDRLPLAGIRVIELSHVVMGPMCGLVLAELGAEVIKVEPPEGDPTRRLGGFGTSFFPLFSGGKKSVALDLQSTAGLAALRRLLESADVLVENFKDSTIEAMGLSSAALHERHPHLIVAAHKGLLSGPYRNRPALDEVVQMTTGLAAMTGTREEPRRVGASMNDVMAGVFGALAVVSQLYARASSGDCKTDIRVGLFENCLLAVGQHIVEYQLTGIEPAPMGRRRHAWPVYDIFECADGARLFLALTTDAAWKRFCTEFSFEHFLSDERLSSVTARINAREWMIPRLRERLGEISGAELTKRLERLNLSFAPIRYPWKLLDDPHVRREGGLVPLTGADGRSMEAPPLPIEFAGKGIGSPRQVPPVGAHNAEILLGLGYSSDEVEQLERATVQ
jgi:crotonobetainyl-CoA:carnitine CoA-transferase CaiB-like acyl-CoA transferase